MSLNAFDSPLRLEWRESRWLTHYTDATHALALLALTLPLQVSLPVRLALVFAVLVSWGWQRFWARPRRRRRSSGTWIGMGHGRWERHYEAGTETLFLEGRSVVLPWVISLRLRDERGRRRFLVICPLELPDTTRRHLLIRLREWARSGGGDQAPA